MFNAPMPLAINDLAQQFLGTGQARSGNHALQMPELYSSQKRRSCTENALKMNLWLPESMFRLSRAQVCRDA